MKPAVASLTTLAGAATVSAAVLARAVVRADVAALKALRQAPVPVPGEPLAPPFLKHADDQTVAGLSAVIRAIHDGGLAGTDFTRWGVVASPRFLARATVAATLKRFGQEGAWGVSPHIIPHRSLHSVSGTVSQALKIHGPNFGVGGGLWGSSNAMLAAAAILEGDRLPGVWVILTGWNWEPGLDNPEHGQDGDSAICSAVAMALTRANTEADAEMRLSISAAPVAGHALAEESGAAPVFALETVAEALEECAAGVRTWRLECGGIVELEKVGAVVEKPS